MRQTNGQTDKAISISCLCNDLIVIITIYYSNNLLSLLSGLNDSSSDVISDDSTSPEVQLKTLLKRLETVRDHHPGKQYITFDPCNPCIQAMTTIPVSRTLHLTHATGVF